MLCLLVTARLCLLVDLLQAGFDGLEVLELELGVDDRLVAQGVDRCRRRA